MPSGCASPNLKSLETAKAQPLATQGVRHSSITSYVFRDRRVDLFFNGFT